MYLLSCVYVVYDIVTLTLTHCFLFLDTHWMKRYARFNCTLAIMGCTNGTERADIELILLPMKEGEELFDLRHEHLFVPAIAISCLRKYIFYNKCSFELC